MGPPGLTRRTLLEVVGGALVAPGRSGGGTTRPPDRVRPVGFPVRWSRRFGRQFDYRAESVTNQGDGTLTYVGTLGDFEAGDTAAWLLSVDPDRHQAVGFRTFDAARALAVDAAGDGVVLAGDRTSGDETRGVDAWVARVDEAGAVQWTASFDFGGRDGAVDVVWTGTAALVAGTSVRDGETASWVLALDETGAERWRVRYEGREVRTLCAGGTAIALAGRTSLDDGPGTDAASSGEGRDAWLATLDSDGSTRWAETYHVVGDDVIASVAPDRDGFALAGYSGVAGGESRAWVVRVRASGERSGETMVGESSRDRALAILPRDDRYVVAGHNPVGDGRAWLASLDARGTRRHNSESHWTFVPTDLVEYGEKLALSGVGPGRGSEGPCGRVEVTDIEADDEWYQTYGGPSRDGAYGLRRTDDGFLFTGFTGARGGYNTTDAWVVQTEVDGGKRWGRTFDVSTWANSGDGESTATESSDAASAVAGLSRAGTNDRALTAAPARDGGYYVLGTTWDRQSSSVGTWVLKLAPEGTEQWRRTFPAPGDEDRFVGDLLVTDEGPVVAGTVGLSHWVGQSETHAWAVGLSPAGDRRWQRTYPGAGVAEAVALARVEGHILVAGHTERRAGRTGGQGGATDHRDGGVWLLELDADGAVRGASTRPDVGQKCVDAAVTDDGGLAVLVPGGLVKLDPDRDVEWRTPLPEATLRSLSTLDDGYLLTGASQAFTLGSDEGWVGKVRLDGSLAWQHRFESGKRNRTVAGTETDDGYAVAGVVTTEEAADQAWLASLGDPEYVPTLRLAGRATGIPLGDAVTLAAAVRHPDQVAFVTWQVRGPQHFDGMGPLVRFSPERPGQYQVFVWAVGETGTVGRTTRTVRVRARPPAEDASTGGDVGEAGNQSDRRPISEVRGESESDDAQTDGRPDQDRDQGADVSSTVTALALAGAGGLAWALRSALRER
jgi:hypothetical protein